MGKNSVNYSVIDIQNTYFIFVTFEVQFVSYNRSDQKQYEWQERCHFWNFSRIVVNIVRSLHKKRYNSCSEKPSRFWYIVRLKEESYI